MTLTCEFPHCAEIHSVSEFCWILKSHWADTHVHACFVLFQRRYEVNEAFACVPMAWAQELGADEEKLNVNGGAWYVCRQPV